MSYLCGCYYHVASTEYRIRVQKHYLPLVDSTVHSTILSTTSRTILKQKFTNPFSTESIKECIYTFPLYDGVSVVSFTCRIGKKVLRGLVKEKVKANQIFNDAVANGETAGLLDQVPEASDVFSTKLGNIPAGQSVIVEITYIGELKHHETDGIRFTIPTKIAPRYGTSPKSGPVIQAQNGAGIKITVDVNMPECSFIKAVQSPSHPIAVSMGTVSTAATDDPLMSKASATLSLGITGLEKDFVLIVQSKNIGIPKAILETHPTIRNHRALMATLVPKFSIPPARPEIVFVADRSGSMQNNMTMLISAMNVFLKSMPVGVKFNICSFGSSFSFLWVKSRSYNQESLQQANDHLLSFQANMGGTETFGAIKATIERRYADIPLEIVLLTDGDIWRQEDLFKYVNQQVEQANGNIRIFPLGIGNGVSHALIEGLARAGNGFAQAVQIGERLENCVVRMLRGALSPHITNYTLEVKYEKENDDFELVDKVTEGMKVLLSNDDKAANVKEEKPTISLFDSSINPEKDKLNGLHDSQFWLPEVPYPKVQQAPHKIPSLFPFSRTSVYLLMSPETIQRNPTAVVLRATSSHGPLALEIPIEALPIPAETIHQLAAKKAVQDLEEGRGWIYDAKDQNGVLVKDRYPSRFDELVQREAVRLGEKFQIAGKWCSFVAVAANDKEIAERENKDIEQKSLVTDDDGDICYDDDMHFQENFASDGSDDGFTIVGESSAPAPPYRPVNSSFSFAARGLPSPIAPTCPSKGRATAFGNFANPSDLQSSNAARASYNPPPPPPKTQAQYQPFGSSAFSFQYSTLKPSESSNEKVLVPQACGQAQPSGHYPGMTPFGFGSQQPIIGRAVRKSSVVADGPTGGLFGFATAQCQNQNLESPQSTGKVMFGNSTASIEGRTALVGGLPGSAVTQPSPSSQSTGQSPGLFDNIPSQSQVSLFKPSPQSNVNQDKEFCAPPSIVHGLSSLFGGIKPASSTEAPVDSTALSTSSALAQAPAPRISERCALQQPMQRMRSESVSSSATFENLHPPADPVVFSPSHEAFKKTPPPPKAQTQSSGFASSLAMSLRKRKAGSTRKEWAIKPITEKVLAVIKLQTFEGSWPADDDQLFEIMGFAKGVLKRADVEKKIWITILVVKWLEEWAGEEEGTWGLVVEKARGWLEGLGVELTGLEKEAAMLVENFENLEVDDNKDDDW